MEIRVLQSELANGLGTASRAINSNNTLPILGNVLLEAFGDNLKISGTNLEVAICCNLQVEVVREGSVTVPAKLLSSYVSLLPNTDVTLSVSEDLNVVLQTSNSRSQIKGLKAEDYPSIPEVTGDVSLSLPASSLLKMINQTVLACSVSGARPVLSGVFMYCDESFLYCVATDSYRLSEAKIASKANSKSVFECIIPAKTMTELAKTLSGSIDTDVAIQISQMQISFEIGDSLIVSRLIEGKFPNYKAIIPEAKKTTCEISVSELQAAIRRLNLFTREVNNSIHVEMDATSNSVILSTGETRVGEEKSEIEVAISGESNKISLNSQYLLDCLQVVSSGKILVEANESVSPIKILDPKDEDFIYIIMPLKV
ncbi:DNA polymerase III subunit beta [bacterium]|jgi:DNA polymerase-3 subunit beta|nr:DNA polymerase III subunit beta [bacterium]